MPDRPCPTRAALEAMAREYATTGVGHLIVGEVVPNENEAVDRTAMTGVDTPGCDCGHPGMAQAWHLATCAWGLDLEEDLENLEGASCDGYLCDADATVLIDGEALCSRHAFVMYGIED